jgi:SAM-dependent methyltransferase
MPVDPATRRSLGVVLATSAVLLALVLWNAVPGRRWYRACYVLGLRVWERRVPPADLVELVEGASRLPAGRALDIGCGTGTDSIYLAQHGWRVAGVDMVPEALAIARRNAAAAGAATLEFVQGDATRLADVAPGPFSLLLDFGCFHTLPTDLRPAYVDSVSTVASPGATFLLYGFARPPRLAPMRAGVSLDEVRGRFAPAWTIERAEQTTADAIQVARTRADRSFELWRFRLRRVA